jgi:hypothetical protein
VPLHIYAPGYTFKLQQGATAPGLANVAASALSLMGFKAPNDYEPSIVSY